MISGEIGDGNVVEVGDGNVVEIDGSVVVEVDGNSAVGAATGIVAGLVTLRASVSAQPANTTTAATTI